MTNSTPMDVLNSTNYLLKKAYCFLFLELLAFNDVLKKFTSGRILHNEKKLAAGLNDLKFRMYSKYLPRRVELHWDV